MKSKSQGFTLLELLVTLVILGIIVSYAIPSFSQFIKSQKVSNESNDFLADISLTRISSLNSGLPAILEPVTAGQWAGDRRIYIDTDSDGVFDENDDELIRITENKHGGYIITGPANVGFNFQGALETSASPVSFTISVKEYNKNKQINVALSGLTNIKDGTNET